MANKARAVTSAQIEAWKKQYGEHKIHELSVRVPIGLKVVGNEDQKFEVFSGVARKPSLEEVLAAEEFAKGDPVQKNLFLFNQCYLGGDPQIQSEDELRMAFANGVSSLFKLYTAEIKKL